MMNWNSLIQQSLIGIDPTVLGALIGVAGTLVCTLTGSLVSHHLQQRNKVKAVKEQERRQKEKEAEATKTTKDRVQEYCDNLRTNPRIAYLQILDMNQPIEVKSIYVRLRLYQEAAFEEEIDRDLVTTQNLHDPDASLQASLKYLEYRTSKALNPSEDLHDYKHCVIVGDPGAGKTTLLKYLIMKSLDKELEGLPCLPLYIELSAFATSHFNDLLEFVAVTWEQYGFSKGEAQDYLAKELKSGNILVLLDGLDETFIGEEGKEAEENYRRVSNAIKNFLQRYDQSPIVVTVRKALYHAGAVLEGFTELMVLDFRPEDIREFVNNWFAHASEGPKRAKDLNDKLEKNRRTLALAANPLLLALITITYQTDPYLLDRKDLERADIYERSVDTLFTIWDARRDVKRRRQFDKSQLKPLLEDVASHFHQQRLLYFSEEELLKVIAGILPKLHLSKEQDAPILAEIILKEIASNNGLLKQQAKKLYGFLHLTLQEYFVAKAFANRDISDIIRRHSDEPWWEEVILLVARYTRDASLSLQIFLQKNEGKPFEEIIFHTDLMLVGRYLAASSVVGEISLPDRIIACLFDTLKKTPYSLTQQQIFSTLTELNKIELYRQEVNERLIGLICDQHIDKGVQELAVDALEILGDRSISTRLWKLLSDPKIVMNRDIRKRIVFKLGTDDRSQFGELYKLLSDINIDVDMRRSIANVLGFCGGKGVVDKLVSVLMQQPDDWNVHAQIIGALSKLGEATVAPLLRSLLSNKNIDQRLRIHIIAALGNLNDQSGITKLQQLLDDVHTDQAERICIIDSLIKLGDTSVAPKLQKLLVDPTTEQKERECIVDSLGKLNNDSVFRNLRTVQSKSEINIDVRQCIAIVMVKFKDFSQVDDLLQLLCDATVSLGMRQRAVIALVKLGDKSVINRLLQLLPGSQVDTDVKRCIVDTLGASGDQALRPTLMRLFSNLSIDPDIRGHIAIALGILGERSITPELLPLLSNRMVEVQVRQRIADNLGASGEHLYVPDLLELLSDQRVDKNVLKHIANAIGQLANDEKAVHALAELLQISEVQDDVHRALWKVSREARVSVSMANGPSGKQPVIHKW